MDYLKEPLIMVIESTGIFALWCKLGLPWKNNKLRLIIYIIFLSIMEIFISRFTLRFILTHIMIVTSVVVVFKRPFKKTLVEFATILLYTYPVGLPIMLLTSLLIDSEYNAYYNRLFSVSLFTAATIILCMLLPLDKWFKRFENTLEKFVLLFVGIMLLSNMYTLVRLNDVDKYIAFCLIFVAFVAVNFAFVQSYAEAREQKEIIRAYEQQTNTVIPLLDEIRSRQHDFKNHLAAIYGFCKQGEDSIDSACEYIEELNESLKNADTLIHIKDKTIGAIIYGKACEAHSKGIDFEYQLPDAKVDFPFAGYEYAAIISNLIDNAFEAALLTDAGTRKVIFKVGSNDTERFIEVWNSGLPIPTKDIPKLFRKGFSTKAEKSGHGLGLYIVKKIADLYNSSIEIVSQGSFTVFRIALPAVQNNQL